MKNYPIRIMVKCGAMPLHFKEYWIIKKFLVISK